MAAVYPGISALSRKSHLQRNRGDSLMVSMFIFSGFTSRTSS